MNSPLAAVNKLRNCKKVREGVQLCVTPQLKGLGIEASQRGGVGLNIIQIGITYFVYSPRVNLMLGEVRIIEH